MGVQNVALLMMKQPQNQYHVKLTPDIQGSVSMMAIVGAMTGQVRRSRIRQQQQHLYEAS